VLKGVKQGHYVGVAASHGMKGRLTRARSVTYGVARFHQLQGLKGFMKQHGFKALLNKASGNEALHLGR
jgi:hypothetical protein